MRQILLHHQEHMTQAAVLDGGELIEFYVERGAGRQWVGNIYLGRVVNVLPGMQAAFVDIGEGKNAFLHVDDVLPANPERRQGKKPSIATLLRSGEPLLVQVMKEPLGSKGARVTTHFSLPGRYLVYMPHAGYIGISKKIEPEEARARLRALGEQLCQGEEGFILRTAAAAAEHRALERDVAALRELWARIRESAREGTAPCEIHCEAGLPQRMIRDMLTMRSDELWTDEPGRFEEAVRMVRELAPGLEASVRLHAAADGHSLFERFGIHAQLETAFAKRVRLPSGGLLVLEQTEALTVIDVNTGRFIGGHDLEDTVYRTNLEAAVVIARLLRLRDIGGIVIVDFIDMTQEAHRERVRLELEERTRTDRAKCHVVGWTRLGLLELTRKKVRASGMTQLPDCCPACDGTGRVAESAAHRAALDKSGDAPGASSFIS
ncbi:Rne/Rng family ribonuclease [Paenibacillus sp. IB182496]|uniref:Rne/Rng family ribonuclease n=1 Tax=Paenibacillus sabuli TaxID=2772509 RepID=A0A927BSA1_9BACL|nr:Rne/Rng family ribonuclease [Paenibacillus sabuli]MBD2844609.1 Rne/Rng family ribonuclease [Paenibacillus sabuli]